MTRRVSWTLCTLLWAAAAAHAAPPEAAPAPDADFLEFLGSWQTGDGRWVDPFHADDLPGMETTEPQKGTRSRKAQELPQRSEQESRDESERKGAGSVDDLRKMKP